MINKINATVLFVKDFEACVKFYRDVLEFKVKDSDAGFMSFDVAGQELALMDIPTASQMIGEEIQVGGTPRTLLAAFLDNTDAAYTALQAKGVSFISPPTTQPWGQRTAYFKDPEGNIWEISHSIPSEEK